MLLNITTRRCAVRHFRAEDIDAFMAYRNDAVWMRYQGFKGLTKEDYESVLLGRQSIRQGVQLAVVCRESDRLIGDLYLKRDGDVCWLGYTISPQKARHGYMFETVTETIRALAAQGIAEIRAGVAPGNDASISLLKKLQFEQVGADEDEVICALRPARSMPKE
ncbi:MAG: GNAT family N-acetyltransferase [Clostridiales bacterium]|nr:GNAT family N-acetyltransferase [Clostridiales bacterium]